MSKRESKKSNNKRAILGYLTKYINDHGYSPSVREIAVAVGLRSTSTVHKYLNELQEDGYIIYADGKRRAISINPEYDTSVSHTENESYDINSTLPNTQNQDDNKSVNKAKEYTNPYSSEYNSQFDSTFALPLIGVVTAGNPILAQENIEYQVQLDDKLFPQTKDKSFMLRVRGDSMINIGINDGDLIIVTPQNSAELNEIVVALIGEEATVKRFAYLNSEPYLFPENDNFDPIPFNREDCSIIGKVVGLIRTRV